jgi:nickel-dependent lactate racemase
MEYFGEGSAATVIDAERTAALLERMLGKLPPLGRVLLVPPDITRLASGAGQITVWLYDRLRESAYTEIMPALGTHAPMTAAELETMFPGIPHAHFRVHDWRHDLVQLGEVPGNFVARVSAGRLDYSIACQVNRRLIDGHWDRVISVGQLVPHEVVGIANHNKNIFVGLGGHDMINKTHFLGAVHGMERLMGRAESPVRQVLDYAGDNFARDLPISYVLTVRGKTATGALVTRGLFAGDDRECYRRGAELCRRINLNPLDRALGKVVVYLDPREFRSTWLGNKAIYRTRMAIADGGELIVLAPGVRVFGEDQTIDRMIRKYGYCGTTRILQLVKDNPDLAANLSAAAHLIHGSSEGRFRITYCPGGLSRAEIESVGFGYAELAPMLARYDPRQLKDGPNTLADGEEIFYVSDPGLGLWGLRARLDASQATQE